MIAHTTNKIREISNKTEQRELKMIYFALHFYSLHEKPTTALLNAFSCITLIRATCPRDGQS